MARRKAPAIPDELSDQSLAGRDPGSALSEGGVLDDRERAFAERALNAAPVAEFLTAVLSSIVGSKTSSRRVGLLYTSL